ncbi:MAG: hypothetical protein KAJ49_05505 [Arcobacteraceae bacterium]|nr:hypothetical protein [Arcobacteraceae bacterium]
MYKNIIFTILTIFVFTGCFSEKNLVIFDELGDDVANQGKIIDNLSGSILTVYTSSDTESMSMVLPKDDLTIRIKIEIPNVEDILYMNIVSTDDFKINKLLRRVSTLNELSTNQDGWTFEPSVEKDVVILQLYLPSIYLYTTQFRPTLNFSYKRSARSLQESIKFNFIKQSYYATHNEDGYEVPKYGNLDEYCAETDNVVSETFLNQIELLNKNRISDDTKDKLRGICQ